jgi:MFS family permease
MHEVGAGWLMVSLSPDPLMVALVQAATTLPIFLLALPGGALADILDRRLYLIATQLWMLACAALLAAMTLTGTVGPWSLLAVTFALAAGAAMMTPAWAATVPELVPRDELPAAIALNSTGINIARAIGPAAAGVLVAAWGPAAAFLANALSFLGIIGVLARWRRPRQPSTLPGERFVGALRAGVRYVRAAPQLHAVMVRALAFFFFASAVWALLPLVAAATRGGSTVYGVLLACIGAGAVGGALVLPRLRSAYSRDAVVRGGTLLVAATMLMVAAAESLAVLVPAMLATGFAWIAVLSSLHVSAQTAVPAWVRARALSTYLVVFALGMAGGSVTWGAVASQTHVPAALALAAAGALLAMAFTWGYTLGEQGSEELLAPASWPEPQTAGPIEAERGPVLVTVEYRVAAGDIPDFVSAAMSLARVRRRDGAVMWALFQDAADPERHLETFVVESWAEHLRQHQRSTLADLDIAERVRAYHRGSAPPQVSHMIAVEAAR